jgi:hypothetical protein
MNTYNMMNMLNAILMVMLFAISDGWPRWTFLLIALYWVFATVHEWKGHNED